MLIVDLLLLILIIKIMGKINELTNNNIPNIKVNNKLLYLVGESIFGIDENDPWSFNYNKLKLLCDAYGEMDKYEYIKSKVEKVMLLINRMDYERGHLVKWDLLENEFIQKIDK